MSPPPFKTEQLFITVLLGACNLHPNLEEAEVNAIQFESTWQSESSNLASNIRQHLQSRTLQIFQDSTYTLTDTDYQLNTSTSKGSFELEESVDGIHSIVFHQELPFPATFKGIVEINAMVSPPEMTLEYVQISPQQESALAPPIIEEGFGSTDNFNQGISNVQKFSIQGRG